MAKRRFTVELACEIEIDSDVIAGIDDDWRKQFYDLKEPHEIAEHLAFNLLVNGSRLSQLDGFAACHDHDADIFRDTISIDAIELRPPRRRKRA